MQHCTYVFHYVNCELKIDIYFINIYYNTIFVFTRDSKTIHK